MSYTTVKTLGILSLALAVAVMADSAAWAIINRNVPKATPTIDGNITAGEMASQLTVPMLWPNLPEGALILDAAGSGIDDISANWYVSWDETNLNISAVVRDNTPDYRVDAKPFGNVAYNSQDVIQPVFNPNNDPAHMFPPDPGGGPAAIYDMAVQTADGFGPDIYRHGSVLSLAEHASISIAGQETATGYILEAAIPWATAMDDVDPGYVPSVGDMHGLSFLLVSFKPDPDGGITLMTDFGLGENTIGDATTWNKISLVPEPSTLGLLWLSGCALLLGRRRYHG